MTLVVTLLEHQRTASDLYMSGDNSAAIRLADEIMQIHASAELPEYSRERGDALYCAYSIFGLSAIAQGDIATGVEMLLLAGKTPPCPARSTFGPNLILAKKLLEMGQVEPVLEFFGDCKETWEMANGRIDLWSKQISQGEIPDFGVNLVYGF